MNHKLIHRTGLSALLTVALAGQVFTAATAGDSDRITVTVRGRGPDVLLIPGLATSSAVWDDTASHLEKHFRLHLIQVAGFAGSPPQTNGQGLAVQPTVDAIDAYIKTNKLQAPRVIGHSLGGLMGAMLAFQHPEDVGGLMIVDALPFYGALFGRKDPAAIVPQATAMRDSILAQTQDDYAKSQPTVMRSLVKSPTGCKLATKWSVASNKSIVARFMYEVMTTDIRPQLHKIKAPVTILHAWDSLTGISQTASDQLYRENYAALPTKTIVRIDDSFHFIMLDQPDKFAAQVDKFLK